jgi:hypothetical protein
MALSRRFATCSSFGGSVTKGMKRISYSGYRFPPEIIHQAIWLYVRFTLSFRDVEDLLAERGITVSYETIRRSVDHFGPMIAADLRKRRPEPHTTRHLDEAYPKNRWPHGLPVACCRRRRRAPRCADPGETEQAGRAETDAQTSEEIRLRSRSVDHGRLAVVWRRYARSRDLEPSRAWSMAQQPGRALASADPA